MNLLPQPCPWHCRHQTTNWLQPPKLAPTQAGHDWWLPLPLVPYITRHPRTPLIALSLPPLISHGTLPTIVPSPPLQTNNNWALRWLSRPWPGLQSNQAHQDLPPKDRSTQQDLIPLLICTLHFWGTRGCGTTACTAPSNSQEEEGFLQSIIRTMWGKKNYIKKFLSLAKKYFASNPSSQRSLTSAYSKNNRLIAMTECYVEK